MKRVLLVNLPHPTPVQRRWVASYQAPNFLLPPPEPLALAALLRREGIEVRFVDAIAERWTAAQVVASARPFAADFVVALAGFGTLERDLLELGRIRDGLRGSRSVLFGHLPSQVPALLALRPEVDLVVRGEPEYVLLELAQGEDPASVAGLAYDEDGAVLTPARPRIRDLDALPPPLHDIDLSRYREPFMPRPIGVLESARGCPFPCAYCVRAYGREVAYHSAAWIGEAVRSLIAQGVRHVRFLDDTFTVDRARTLAICAELAPLGVTWTCLTRLDRLDAELCQAMAGAGCRRLYVGVESADPAQLKAWRKGETVADFERGAAAARSADLELSGFFIVGAPGEDRRSVEASADLAHRLGLDFVIVTRLQTWPGTTLHEELGLPDTWGVADEDDPFAIERVFYRRFYLRPRAVARQLRRAARHPRDAAVGLFGLGRYVAGAVRGRDFI